MNGESIAARRTVAQNAPHRGDNACADQRAFVGGRVAAGARPSTGVDITGVCPSRASHRYPPAVEYALLGTPARAVKVGTGGLASPTAQVSKDAAPTMAAGLVGAPPPLARRVATETRRESLEEYRAAFNVTNPYLDTGTLSETAAFRPSRRGPSRNRLPTRSRR